MAHYVLLHSTYVPYTYVNQATWLDSCLAGKSLVKNKLLLLLLIKQLTHSEKKKKFNLKSWWIQGATATAATENNWKWQEILDRMKESVIFICQCSALKGQTRWNDLVLTLYPLQVAESRAIARPVPASRKEEGLSGWRVCYAICFQMSPTNWTRVPTTTTSRAARFKGQCEECDDVTESSFFWNLLDLAGWLAG